VEQSAPHCQVCGQAKPGGELKPVNGLRGGLEDFVKKHVPDGHHDRGICSFCLNRLRTDFVRAQIEEERGALSTLEKEAQASLENREQIAKAFSAEYDSRLTVGDRVADKMAEFGGSWAFVGAFLVLIAVWIVLNSGVLLPAPVDPFPFILLNLALSLLAAIQAPVIMMSQNRQEERDRASAENDYGVNQKAEIEVRVLNAKMDQLLHNQWVHLLEIQQIQMEMLEDLRQKQTRADA
jgi:uncharacterized membrane protein